MKIVFLLPCLPAIEKYCRYCLNFIFAFSTLNHLVLLTDPVLWRSLIVKHNGILNNNLDISSLAKVTDGYTPGHIDEVRLINIIQLARNIIFTK